MKYLYRIFKIILWGLYAFVLLPFTWLFANILTAIWHLDFKHYIPIKDEWKDALKWESVESDLVNHNGEWTSEIRYYYFSNPKQLFLNQRNYID